MTQLETFKLTVEPDGIAFAVFDVPDRSMNTLTQGAMRDIAAIVERVRDDALIRGLIITSGKASGFCAGADIGELEDGQEAGFQPSLSDEQALQQRFERAFAFNRVLRALETCGKPVAAAINGLALGGGLEVALACHYRVSGDHPRIQLGLPEAKIGLLPGAGGTQRLPRLIGAAVALPFILDGNAATPQEALRAGMIHAVVPSGAELGAAREWIRAKGDPVQPWDKRDFRLPGGAPHSPGGGQVFVLGNAMLRKQSHGNYPAQNAIIKCIYEGIQVPIDAGLRIESRYFAQLIAHPTARNMMRSLFLSRQELSKGARRPKDEPPAEIRKVAVLGAGIMGAGVAHAQAMAGIDTVLLDTTIEAAERGKSFTRGRVSQAVERGRMGRDRAEAILERITATVDYADLEGADLAVEAVYENREIKAGVTRQAEAVLPPGAVLGTNTSTLPIGGLAEASSRPENFIGLHFLAPVDQMELVEIVRGPRTSDRTLATAMDYLRRLRKTPIVVNDAPGFYVARCSASYIAEGLAMVSEGIAPAIIENVGRMAGMPRGPLEMADDAALDLAYRGRQQARQEQGSSYVAPASDALLEAMVLKNGRYGRRNGKGFYDYPVEGAKRLWPGLAEIVDIKTAEISPAETEAMKMRLLYRQAIEAARCVADGVITDPRDADVGAILGWGFASWTGGPLSFIDTVGMAAFVAEADRMTDLHGRHFAPPAILREMASAGQRFYASRT